MTDLRHLVQRGHSWSYRRRVPNDLKLRWAGSDPICRALHTTDVREAQRLRAVVDAEIEQQFAALRGKVLATMSPAEIEERARREFDQTRLALAEYEVDAPGCAALIAVEDRKLSLADPSVTYPEIGPGVPERVTDLDYARINARRAAMLARRAALTGGKPEVPEVFGRRGYDPATLEPVVPRKRSKGGLKFAEAAARFVQERQRDPTARLTEQTRGQYEAAYRLFESFANNPALADVDRARASEFLDRVAKFDPMWGRSPHTKGRSFDELEKRYGSGANGLSNKTVNRIAMALSLVWKFAEDRGEFTGSNPWTRQARKVGVRRGSKKVDKRGYSPDELAKLFTIKPVVAPNQHDMASTMPWLIWIASYSGMRLNEIASLDVEDVKRIGDVDVIDIPESKSEAGVRVVPLHSRLLTLGLMKYIKRIGKGPLFPGLKPGGPDGKRSWYASKRFTTLRRSLGLVEMDANGKDRLDFHSLRRSAITALEAARWPEHETAEVMGHEHTQITFGVYPDRAKAHALRRTVEAIQYEGIDY